MVDRRAANLVGALALAHRSWPNEKLPTRRLVGLGLITLSLITFETLFGQWTGLVGSWLTGFLQGVAGGPLTVVIAMLATAAGVILALDVKRVATR